MNTSRISKLCITLSLVACTREYEFSLPDDEALQLTEFADGAVAGQCTISVVSAQRQALNSWFASNKSGWENTPGSYAPDTLIEGKGFIINVRDTQVVIVNLGTQYVKQINAAELSFLACSAD